jgi:hypothetical protein
VSVISLPLFKTLCEWFGRSYAYTIAAQTDPKVLKEAQTPERVLAISGTEPTTQLAGAVEQHIQRAAVSLL